ncbi:MAG: hypothetical protein M0Z39_00970 [Actinomycetota bacterium]|nr:hypothetical protein [Actinomycetota bacterium]
MSSANPWGHVPRNGFETVAESVKPPVGTLFVAVAALDSSGRELGRSRFVSA